MLLPTDLIPSTLGLAWNMTQDECLQALHVSPIARSSGQLVIPWPIEGISYRVVLWFLNQQRLDRIHLDMRESRSFFDSVTEDEEERIRDEYQDAFNSLVEQFSSRLGTPDYFGSWSSDGYPEDETAWQIAYWYHPEARLQLELDHADRELPYCVRIVCYPNPA